MYYDQDLITEKDIAEIEAWDPKDQMTPESGVGSIEVRRLLLSLEVAVRDCRQASQEVKNLLPSMNAVAQNIERAALSAIRLLLAGCGGALVGAMAMWLLVRGGSL